MDFIMTFFDAVVDIVNEMSPYLLLGFLIAGVMHAFIPNGWFSKYLSGNSLRSVINAAVFGVPLPLCSCGVIPTAMSLRREGAGKGAVVSFLIATPQTGVDSIFATYSLMGLPFAVVRPIVALVTAILGGVFVNSFEKGEDDVQHDEARNMSENADMSFVQKVGAALQFGFVEMMEDIGKWLIVGLIIAGMITAFVPDEWFGIFKDNSLLSMLLVLAISIPMYVCATGSIPIAVALMMKGLTPGSALVLLMAGPAANAASILVINKVMGRKTLVLYLIAIVTGALCFGFAIDYLLPREWFTMGLHDAQGSCCHEETGWLAWTCSALLVAMLLNVLRLRLMHKETCSCGHCHGESGGHGNHDGHCSCGHHEHEGGCQCGHCHGEEDETREYSVKGMTCNHCRANVEKAIMRVDGVEEVTVDLHAGTANVSGEHLDDDAICKAVEAIGFEIERI